MMHNYPLGIKNVSLSEKSISLAETVSFGSIKSLPTFADLYRAVNSGVSQLTGIFRSGTLIVYQEPGKPLGNKIKYEGLTINIDQQYAKLKGYALISNHPDFTFENGVISAQKIETIPSFPDKSGWYKIDESCMPLGNYQSSHSDKQSAYLWRNNHGPYIGLLVVGAFDPIEGKRSVTADISSESLLHAAYRK